MSATATYAAEPPVQPYALSVIEAVRYTGNSVSRTRMFDLIRNGDVDARKIGRRTVIMAASLRDFLDRAPRAA